MATELGNLRRHGALSLTGYTASGNGDFSLITPASGYKFAVTSIQLGNSGVAAKAVNILDGGSTGSSISRVLVDFDVNSLVMVFEPPVIMDGVYIDSVSGTDTIRAGALAEKFKVGS